jgi:hypothetical protein
MYASIDFINQIAEMLRWKLKLHLCSRHEILTYILLHFNFIYSSLSGCPKSYHDAPNFFSMLCIIVVKRYLKNISLLFKHF